MSSMNTTKFDNLVIASRRAAENAQLSSEAVSGQGHQPGSGQARPNGVAVPGLAHGAAIQAQHAQSQSSGKQLGNALAKQGLPMKKKPAKRKRDDGTPKRPRGRPRKYPLPPDFLGSLTAPQHKAQQQRPEPPPGTAAVAAAAVSPVGAGRSQLAMASAALPATRAPAALHDAQPAHPSAAPEQNGASLPGMSLYDAWSRSQAANALGSPSKQAALYTLLHQQQQAAQQQQQQLQPTDQQQEQIDLSAMVPHGFMALMAEYAQTALTGMAQEGILPNAGLPLPALMQEEISSLAAPCQAASAATSCAPVPLPPFLQPGSIGQSVVPSLPGQTTRSPSRRKPQKSPAKLQQAPLGSHASPARMQQALSQSTPASSPAQGAASPTGRSRAQRKNAATPHRVVSGAAAPVAVSLLPASAAGAEFRQPAGALQDALQDAAPAAPEGILRQPSAAAPVAQQAAAGAAAEQPQGCESRQAAAAALDAAVHPNPSQFALDDDLSPTGEELVMNSIDYPGLRASQVQRRMKLLTELAKSEKEVGPVSTSSVPGYHVSQTGLRPHRRGSEAEPQELTGAAAAPAIVQQPQVTGPTEISDAATASYPELERSGGKASGKTQAKRKGKGAADKRTQSDTHNTRPSAGAAAAAVTRNAHSEPKAPAPGGHTSGNSDADARAVAARPRAAQQQANASAVGGPPLTGAMASAHIQTSQAQSLPSSVIAAVGADMAPDGIAAALLGAAQPPAAPPSAPAAGRSQPAAPASAARQKGAPAASLPAQGRAGAAAFAEAEAGSQAGGAGQAAVMPAAGVADAPQPPSGAPRPSQQELRSASGIAPAQPAALSEPQQASAASGAMKEELNNTLLACLAQEAKSAHAAQEAIEFCRAAEEGLEHLKKQYNLQESFTASYEKVVDEVSEALQATSAANRKVQEVQERLNAVQEELKQEVAAAELARSHAMTVLRKQQTLKEEMEVAREEVSRILHQPHTDLEQLRDTVSAQAEHVLNMRAARDEATGSLARCRRSKDELLRLMNLEPPHAPAAGHASSAGLNSAGR